MKEQQASSVERYYTDLLFIYYSTIEKLIRSLLREERGWKEGKWKESDRGKIKCS